MKVFVASTHQDLLSYRAATTRAILAAGDLSEDMLYWPAEDSPSLDVSLRHLRSSDLMILLIAHLYGTPPTGHDRSITELEFDEALELNLPILAFQVDPAYPWAPRFVETKPEARARLANFTQRVKEKVTTSLFSTPDSLELAITRALSHFVGRQMPMLPAMQKKLLFGELGGNKRSVLAVRRYQLLKPRRSRKPESRKLSSNRQRFSFATDGKTRSGSHAAYTKALSANMVMSKYSVT